MQRDLLIRTEPLPSSVLESLNVSKAATCVELTSGDELYGLVCNHLVKSSTARSFTMQIGNARPGCDGCCDSDDEDESQEQSRVANKEIGLGVFSIEFDGKPIYALHHR